MDGPPAPAPPPETHPSTNDIQLLQLQRNVARITSDINWRPPKGTPLRREDLHLVACVLHGLHSLPPSCRPTQLARIRDAFPTNLAPDAPAVFIGRPRMQGARLNICGTKADRTPIDLQDAAPLTGHRPPGAPAPISPNMLLKAATHRCEDCPRVYKSNRQCGKECHARRSVHLYYLGYPQLPPTARDAAKWKLGSGRANGAQVDYYYSHDEGLALWVVGPACFPGVEEDGPAAGAAAHRVQKARGVANSVLQALEAGAAGPACSPPTSPRKRTNRTLRAADAGGVVCSCSRKRRVTKRPAGGPAATSPSPANPLPLLASSLSDDSTDGTLASGWASSSAGFPAPSAPPSQASPHAAATQSGPFPTLGSSTPSPAARGPSLPNPLAPPPNPYIFPLDALLEPTFLAAHPPPLDLTPESLEFVQAAFPITLHQPLQPSGASPQPQRLPAAAAIPSELQQHPSPIPDPLSLPPFALDDGPLSYSNTQPTLHFHQQVAPPPASPAKLPLVLDGVLQQADADLALPTAPAASPCSLGGLPCDATLPGGDPLLEASSPLHLTQPPSLTGFLPPADWDWLNDLPPGDTPLPLSGASHVADPPTPTNTESFLGSLSLSDFSALSEETSDTADSQLSMDACLRVADEAWWTLGGDALPGPAMLC